jgi:hypothetical protein
MSCILALREGDIVHCLADTACTVGDNLKVKMTSKMFITETKEYIIGGSGVGRFINIIQYLDLPSYKEYNFCPHKFMICEFIPVLMEAFEPLRQDDSDNHCVNSFGLVVAFTNKIYTIYADFSVLEHEDYAATGSPFEAAIVGLNIVTKNLSLYPGKIQLEIILDSIIEHNNYVSKPYIYFNTGMLGG